MKLILCMALCFGIVFAGASTIEINAGEIVANTGAYFVFASGNAIHINTGTPFFSENVKLVPATTETVFFGPEGSLDALSLTPVNSMGSTTVKNYSGVLYPSSTNAVPRWWSITPTTEDIFDLMVRLRNSELTGFVNNDLRVWEHNASTGWHMISLAPNSVTVGSSFTEFRFTGMQFTASGKGSHNIVLNTEESQTLPVELSSFAATISAYNYVMLQWVTQSETNVSGYRIYRSNSENLVDAENLNCFIEAANSSQGQSYLYYDKEITEDGVYYYWLESQDIDGASNLYGPTSINVTFHSGNQPPVVPLIDTIQNIYPNPFNPTVTISYSIKAPSIVDAKIYNIRGQMVKSLFRGSKVAGFHKLEWNGVDDNGAHCSSGIYTVVVTIGKDSFRKNIVMLK